MYLCIPDNNPPPTLLLPPSQPLLPVPPPSLPPHLPRSNIINCSHSWACRRLALNLISQKTVFIFLQSCAMKSRAKGLGSWLHGCMAMAVSRWFHGSRVWAENKQCVHEQFPQDYCPNFGGKAQRKYSLGNQIMLENYRMIHQHVHSMSRYTQTQHKS